jgi:hypothetical protein
MKVTLFKILPDKEDTGVVNRHWFRHIKTPDAHSLVCDVVYLNFTDMFHDNTKTVSQNLLLLLRLNSWCIRSLPRVISCVCLHDSEG